jgi:hypothetical protein
MRAKLTYKRRQSYDDRDFEYGVYSFLDEAMDDLQYAGTRLYSQKRDWILEKMPVEVPHPERAACTCRTCGQLRRRESALADF